MSLLCGTEISVSTALELLTRSKVSLIHRTYLLNSLTPKEGFGDYYQKLIANQLTPSQVFLRACWFGFVFNIEVDGQQKLAIGALDGSSPLRNVFIGSQINHLLRGAAISLDKLTVPPNLIDEIQSTLNKLGITNKVQIYLKFD